MEVRLAELLRFVAANEGASTARAAKSLGMAQSELGRLLAILGDDAAVGGLGLVGIREDGSRRCLQLNAQGRAWLEQHA